MTQRTQKKPVRRLRPEPPSRAPTPPRRRGPLPGNRRRSVPWWAVALVAIVCGGVLWLVLGQEDEGGSPEGAPSVPGTEVGADKDSDVAGEVPAGSKPSATVASRFARPAAGERLELRVLSLGDDPNRCEAASLRVAGEVRTAYHHECDGRDADVAFFLVRMTGLAADPVTVDVTAFELVTKDGRRLAPLDLADVARRFPAEIALGPDVSRKGWVVFEDPGVPLSLRYADADQELAVRFMGTWL